ncbi:integrase [Shewanella sp. 10N.7]|uniref:integrase n=1 Tax=Shewanella sp. 10N.7 TaxID=2885093 RepID=UPI001E439A6A|nr:integrase [Shewanella sp. 10N.7]
MYEQPHKPSHSSMMNSGIILVLRQILGHTDIKDTMRYAHFAPDHLDNAITKNPITGLLK